MGVRFPCGICTKAVGKNHKAIQCDICDNWVHIKCNKIDKKTYELLKGEQPWYCLKCTRFLLPFSSLTDHEFVNIKEI